MKLAGDPSLVRAKVSLKSMQRLLQKQGNGYLVECNQIETNAEEFLQQHKEAVPDFFNTSDREVFRNI